MELSFLIIPLIAGLFCCESDPVVGSVKVYAGNRGFYILYRFIGVDPIRRVSIAGDSYLERLQRVHQLVLKASEYCKKTCSVKQSLMD
jgi:hypothetical protein